MNALLALLVMPVPTSPDCLKFVLGELFPLDNKPPALDAPLDGLVHLLPSSSMPPSSATTVHTASAIKLAAPSALVDLTAIALMLLVSSLALPDPTPSAVLPAAPSVRPVLPAQMPTLTASLPFLADLAGSPKVTQLLALSALPVLNVLSVTTTLKLLAPTEHSPSLDNLTALPALPVTTVRSPPFPALSPCSVKLDTPLKFPALPVNTLLKVPSNAKIAQLVSTAHLKSPLMVDAMSAPMVTTLLKAPLT